MGGGGVEVDLQRKSMVRRPSQKRPVGRGKKARPSGRVRCHPRAAAMPPVSELESPKLKSTGREPGRHMNPEPAAAAAAAAGTASTISSRATSSAATDAGSKARRRRTALPPDDIGDRGVAWARGAGLARLDPCLSARHVRRGAAAREEIEVAVVAVWQSTGGFCGNGGGRMYICGVRSGEEEGRGRMELPHLAIYDTAAGSE